MVASGDSRFAEQPPPDPRGSRSLDDLVACLKRTRQAAGSPSYRDLANAVTERRRQRTVAVAGETVPQVPYQTIGYLFGRSNRKDLDYDLVFDLLAVLGVPDEGVRWWREAWATASSSGGAAATVNTSLPVDDSDFVGRGFEIEQMSALATAPASGNVVVSIEGLGGVGKTRLATYVARLLVERGLYDDVQLYVNLHGFDTEGRQPAESEAVLKQLIRALRRSGQPPSGRSALIRTYRNLLLGRKAVIVLDNAATEEQVRDLLPGHPGTMVIITSRNTLTGLPGVVPLSLDVVRARGGGPAPRQPKSCSATS